MNIVLIGLVLWYIIILIPWLQLPGITVVDNFSDDQPTDIFYCRVTLWLRAFARPFPNKKTNPNVLCFFPYGFRPSRKIWYLVSSFCPLNQHPTTESHDLQINVTTRKINLPIKYLIVILGRLNLSLTVSHIANFGFFFHCQVGSNHSCQCMRDLVETNKEKYKLRTPHLLKSYDFHL